MKMLRAMLLPLVAAGVIAISAQSAIAFGGGSPYSEVKPIGDRGCEVQIDYSPSGNARVALQAGFDDKIAGSSVYSGGSRTYFFSGAMTSADINSCFTGPVTGVSIPNPTANLFAGADYLGFKYTFGGVDYEYAIKGATDTEVVAGPISSPQPAEGPTVQIDAPESHNGEDFSVIVRFSEPVTALRPEDVTVMNGEVLDMEPTNSVEYGASIRPSGDGDVTIDIAAGVTQSESGDVDNQAATRVVVRGSSNEATVQKIQSFIQNRATHVLNHQPSLSGFIDGFNLAGGGPLGNLGLSANADRMDLAFSSSLSRIQAARQAAEAGHDNGLAAIDQSVEAAHASSYAAPEAANRANAGLDNIDALDNSKDYGIPQNRFDVWTQLYASRAKLNQSRADTIVAYLGAHYFVNPNLIVGAMAQYDSVSEKNGSSSVDGTGWMAGPYIAGRLPGHSLLYEARIAWGQSNNKISPTGTYKDRFDTTRWIATGQIEGDILLSSLDQMTRVAFNPFLRATYFEEKQDSYIDSNGSRVEGQTYSVGEIRFGPKFTLVTELDNGVRLTPFVSASGLWDFKMSGNDSSQNSALKEGSLRARLDAGLGIKTANDWLFNMSSFHDGIGVDKYQAYGGKVRLTIPLN
ncbi:autotransporter outer membrane beta-barrel domain-containing protein [Cohaesibacter gelatinilyticus]|uniref:Outer membrane autotransporter barrel domain-containing protein n=1 Tax=Cohaesibacter gelatinilyticus TaxID=372072 RepID=A0A285PHR7_9HYPH|nr:autotransporter outer membrane beta-barrel domain-containing protein [Cohaesibacter gelatinilyticus]SNZ19411.1 outer membrane autotransporter barrel domain-containing protein [Cohaesibacter gelatinilyticus]